MNIKVESVKALDKYKIHVVFNDGTNGIFDLGNVSGKGVFSKLKDDNNFNKVFINNENGAITWPGEIDIDTLNVYFTIKGISPEEYFRSQKVYAEHL